MCCTCWSQTHGPRPLDSATGLLVSFQKGPPAELHRRREKGPDRSQRTPASSLGSPPISPHTQTALPPSQLLTRPLMTKGSPHKSHFPVTQQTPGTSPYHCTACDPMTCPQARPEVPLAQDSLHLDNPCLTLLCEARPHAPLPASCSEDRTSQRTLFPGVELTLHHAQAGGFTGALGPKSWSSEMTSKYR